MEILCSTGALLGRPNNRDYRLLEGLAKQLCCDGYEFMVYSSWYPEEEQLLSFIKGLKLNIPVVHCEKEIGESISKGGDDCQNAVNRFKTNCKIASELGAKKMVVHLWGGLTSDSNFQNNLNAYPLLLKICNDYGIQLLIENIVCNNLDPMTRWSQLYKSYPDVQFVFDTKMSEFHSQTDLLYSDDYSWLTKENHIRHFHLNDYAGGYMEWSKLQTLAIGSGHVNFARLFGFLKEIKYNGSFTVESTAFDKEGRVDVDMLNRQFAFIRDEMAK